MKEDDQKEKPILFQILRVISLLPILLWPLIWYGTIFFFDAQNSNPALVYFAFFAINAYPIYLIGNLFLSNKMYPKNAKISMALLLWPILLFGFFIIAIFVN